MPFQHPSHESFQSAPTTSGPHCITLQDVALLLVGLLLMALLSGCGDGSSPTGQDPSPGTDAGLSSPATGAGNTVPPATDDPTETGNTGAEIVLGPLLMDLGVDVGTRPGMEGALFDVDGFPKREIITVLAPDAIPAITDPVMLDKDQVTYITDSDLVFGVVIDGDARAYPHNIGWWHEIVNDIVGDRPICITFCPLTGTGLVYDGVDVNGERLELGVSGLLYNTNLIMFNRNEPRSLYPQIFSTAISGDRQGHTLDLLPAVETTWGAWKELYPQTKVMAQGSYPASRYSQYPYGDYRSNNGYFLFPVRPTLATNPNRLTLSHGTKDRVIGIRVDGDAVAFPFDEMGDQQILETTVGGLEIAIAWDAATQMAIPFARRVGDRTLSFKLVDEGFPFSMQDRETGSLWNLRGLAIEGELAGERLVQVPSHNAMWFAWVSFWPDTQVWSP